VRPVGRYQRAAAATGLAVPAPGACPTDETLRLALALSHDEDAMVRRLAVKNLCPCHVRKTHADVWDRIFELVADPDPGVRMSVIHAMTDGSPREAWPRVEQALDSLRNDPDPRIRKHVRRTQAAQRRKGTANVN
jgi:hypothetical protein